MPTLRNTALRHCLSAACLAILFASNAHASDIQAELRIGEPEIGLSVRGPLQQDVQWRLDYLTGTRPDTRTFRQKDFDLNWKRRELMAGLEISPFGNQAYVLMGLVFDHGRIDASMQRLSGTLVINHRTYQLDDVGELRATMRPSSRVVPFLGLGWRSQPVASGWSVSVQAGVMPQYYEGSATVTCGASLGAAACTQLKADVAKEEARMNNSLRKVDFIPSASVGLSYRF